MSRPRLVAIATLAIALAVLAPAVPASALSIESATVKVEKTGAGTFRLKGRYAGVSFDSAETFVLTFDRVSLQLPLARFTRRRKILTYRGAGDPGSVTRLRIDTRRRRFLLEARGWVPPSPATPFPLGVGTEEGGDCRIVRLRDPAAGKAKAARAGRARRATRLLLAAPRGADDPCGAIGQPRTRPVVIEPGVSTSVRVEVEIEPAAGVDPSGLQVFRLDAAGAPAGDALCTLAADPQRNDRTYTCTATVTGDAPGLLPLVVLGRAGTARVTSPGFSLAVAGAPSDADIDAVSATGARMVAAWKAAGSQYGNTLAARMETLRVLAGDPGLLSSGLSPDGLDLVVQYQTGWLGGLILNTSSSEGTQAAVVATPRAAQSASVVAPGVPRGVFRTCGGGTDPGTGGICCASPERAPLLGRGVLIWSPGFFAVGEPPYGPVGGGDVEDARIIGQKFTDHACLGFDAPDRLVGEAADVASVLTFPNYQTLLISSHGVVDKYDRTVLVTGERLTRDSGRRYDHELDQADVQSWALPGSNVMVLGVSPDFIAAVPRRYPENAIVYASYCYSARNGAFEAFLAVGAGVHFGFDWSVHSDYSLQVGADLFEGLLTRLQTTGDAFDRVTPKTDPKPLVGRIPYLSGPPDPAQGTVWIRPNRAANFVRNGSSQVAYVDDPRVEPELSALPAGGQAMLTATVEGAGTCDLKFHWHNSAEHGHLTGDGGTDDFMGSGSMATYTAADDGQRGTDDIGVEVLSPGEEEAVGVDCAEAMVESTSTTTTTSSTTTTTIECTSGVLESVDVLTTIQAGVSASAQDVPPQMPKSFTVGPNELVTLGPGGGSDSNPWDLTLTAGGAEGHSMGNVTYLVSPCRITAQGTFKESAIGGSATAEAMADIYASLQMTYAVSQFTPYVITGTVSASGNPVTTLPTEEFIKCFGNQDFAEADLRHPPGPVPFEVHRSIFPEEQHFINCTIDRGAATADGTGDDHADMSWTFTIDFGVE